MTTWNAAPMPELGLELVRDVDRERFRSRLPRWDPRLWGDAQFSKNTRPGNRLLKLGLAWGRERVKARKLQQENVTSRSDVAPVFRFTGKEEDIEIGLQYFGKRFLSPYLGRWVSADPLAVHAPGEADLNLYAYVHGAVLRMVDPLGLASSTAPQGGTDSGPPPDAERDGAGNGNDQSKVVEDQTPAETLMTGAAAACTLASGGSCAIFLPALVASVPGDSPKEMSPEHEKTQRSLFTIGLLGIGSKSPSGRAATRSAKAISTDAEVGEFLDDLVSSQKAISESSPATAPVAEQLGLGAARGAANFTRPLQAADFGASATVKALEGTLSVQDKVATVGIKYVEGNLGNPITALNALKETARQAGATTLRIEGTIANPRLEPVLSRILGPATRGAPGGPQDIWVLGL